MRYTQIMSTARATLPLLGLLLGSLLSLVACRELASPQANLEDRQLVHGIVVRADSVVVPGTKVEITPQSSVFSGQYEEVVYTDDEGRFTAEAPKIPLRVDLLPTISFGSPRHIEEAVEFAPGVERRFVLPGFGVPGVITDSGHMGHFARSWVQVGLYYVDAEGQERRVWDIAHPDNEGHFEAFVFQPGPVHLAFVRRYSGIEATVFMPGNWELSPGDSLLLALPLVPIQLEMSLGGDPLPPRGILIHSDHPDGETSSEYEDYLAPDGSQRISDAAALEGATRIQIFRPWGSGFGSNGAWVPQLIEVAALQGGESLRVELGAFELAIQVLDPAGSPLRATVRASSLQLSWREALPTTNFDGQCSIQVNPGLHRLRVIDTEYADYEEWIEISGDMSFTIKLSEAP